MNNESNIFVEESANGQVHKIYVSKDGQLFIIILTEDMAKAVVYTLHETQGIDLAPHENGDFKITLQNSEGDPVTVTSKGEIIPEA